MPNTQSLHIVNIGWHNQTLFERSRDFRSPIIHLTNTQFNLTIPVTICLEAILECIGTLTHSQLMPMIDLNLEISQIWTSAYYFNQPPSTLKKRYTTQRSDSKYNVYKERQNSPITNFTLVCYNFFPRTSCMQYSSTAEHLYRFIIIYFNCIYSYSSCSSHLIQLVHIFEIVNNYLMLFLFAP